MTAADALGGIGDAAKEAVPALAHTLSDSDTFVRIAAVLALWGIGAGSAPAVPKLIELLHDPDAHVRRPAASALSKSGQVF